MSVSVLGRELSKLKLIETAGEIRSEVLLEMKCLEGGITLADYFLVCFILLGGKAFDKWFVDDVLERNRVILSLESY